MSLLRTFSIAALVFFGLDFLWLGFVAPPLYRATIGPLLRPEPNVTAAVLFYALYLLGVVTFVIRDRPGNARFGGLFARGAWFGLVAYGTFDLTCLAVLEGWSVTITVVDMAWGAVLTGFASAITHRLVRGRAS